jgi:hypothetical protein
MKSFAAAVEAAPGLPSDPPGVGLMGIVFDPNQDRKRFKKLFIAFFLSFPFLSHPTQRTTEQQP